MSRRIITLLFTLIGSLTFGQNVEGLEHEYFTTRNSPHAQYQRFTYRYQNIPILEHQYLEIRSLDGNMIKRKSSLSQEARAALNPSLEGPYLLWRSNNWLSVIPDTTNDGVEHYVSFYNSENKLIFDSTMYSFAAYLAFKAIKTGAKANFGAEWIGASYCNIGYRQSPSELQEIEFSSFNSLGPAIFRAAKVFDNITIEGEKILLNAKMTIE